MVTMLNEWCVLLECCGEPLCVSMILDPSVMSIVKPV